MKYLILVSAGTCLDPTPAHGRISSYSTVDGTFSVGDHVDIDCDFGYRVNRYPRIECTESAIWSPSPPECIPSNESKKNMSVCVMGLLTLVYLNSPTFLELHWLILIVGSGKYF